MDNVNTEGEPILTPIGTTGSARQLSLGEIFQDQFDPKEYNFVARQPGLTPRHQVGSLFLAKSPHPLNRRRVQNHLCEVVAVSPDPLTGYTRYGLMYWTGDYLEPNAK